jgi:hypothetical protein
MDDFAPFSGDLPYYPDGDAHLQASSVVAPHTLILTGGIRRTILFCWELGGGLGHLMQMLPLADDLVKSGHRVFVALRDHCSLAPARGAI